ncbi:MAG: hypothetical protein PUD72_03695 [Oscillospiraceae bacterium]|nr:hypothetical protein [Oscillospiraceae bacterium]
MTVEERVMLCKLCLMIEENPEFCKELGIVVKSKDMEDEENE